MLIVDKNIENKMDKRKYQSLMSHRSSNTGIKGYLQLLSSFNWSFNTF